MKFQIGKKYNFNTIVPTILGDLKEMMEVVAICNLEQAMKYEDVITRHSIVGHHLPVKLLAKDLQYIVFKTSDERYEVIALEYINSESIVVVEKVNLLIEVKNINSDDIMIITENLNSLGYIDLKITKTIK